MKVEKNLATFTVEEPEVLTIDEIGKDLFEIKLHDNIVLIEEEKYQSDLTIITCKCANLNDLKGAMVKLKYNQNEEYAVINRGILSVNDAEYVEYRNFVDTCKSKANEFWVAR